MKNIFISYSSKEYTVARKFFDAFSARGMSCWMAPESIPGGSNYAIEIPKAIQDCQVFVLILSENSQNSIWVRKEIDLAVNLHKLIFPIRIGNYGLISPFDFYLTDIQLMQASEDPKQLAIKLEQLLAPSASNIDNTQNTPPVFMTGSAPTVAQSKKQNTFIDLVKNNKKFIILAAVVVTIGVGAAIAVTAGTGSPTVQNDIISEPGSENTSGIMAEIKADDIKKVTDLEFTLIYGTDSISYTGKFSGETADGLVPHGIGTFVGTNEDGATISYEGGFAYGMLEGQGSYIKTYPKDDEREETTLTATFKNNLIEGKADGKTVYRNGDVKEEEGEYINGKANGKGKSTYNYANGDIKVTEGELVDGKLHGQGKQTLVSVSEGYTRIYEGGFSNGNWHGQGVQTIKFTNGYSSVYEGNFSNGYRNGKGIETCTDTNGDIVIYEGDWVNGNRSGQGTWKKTYASGDLKEATYEGDWIDGKANGHGTVTYIYANGDVEVSSGEFVDDNLNGHGAWKKNYASGDIKEMSYEGDWVDDCFNGQGTETHVYANGDIKVWSGEFVDDLLNGQGQLTITYANGETEIFEGIWKDGNFVE